MQDGTARMTSEGRRESNHEGNTSTKGRETQRLVALEEKLSNNADERVRKLEGTGTHTIKTHKSWYDEGVSAIGKLQGITLRERLANKAFRSEQTEADHSGRLEGQELTLSYDGLAKNAGIFATLEPMSWVCNLEQRHLQRELQAVASSRVQAPPRRHHNRHWCLCTLTTTSRHTYKFAPWLASVVEADGQSLLACAGCAPLDQLAGTQLGFQRRLPRTHSRQRQERASTIPKKQQPFALQHCSSRHGSRLIAAKSSTKTRRTLPTLRAAISPEAGHEPRAGAKH